MRYDKGREYGRDRYKEMTLLRAPLSDEEHILLGNGWNIFLGSGSSAQEFVNTFLAVNKQL